MLEELLEDSGGMVTNLLNWMKTDPKVLAL